MSKKLFKIGELSDLYDVSSDIIRHYDKIGLFKPAYVETNGYRYYSTDQIFELELILNLRSLDLSLDDIKRIMHQGEGAANMEHILTTQADALRTRIDELQTMLEKTQKYLDLMNLKGSHLNKWTLGTRPDIYCIDKMFDIQVLPDMRELKEKTRPLKKGWYHTLNFFIQSPVSVLTDMASFEDTSSFSYASYEKIPVNKTLHLPPSQALCCSFHGKEASFESVYREGAKTLQAMDLQAKGNIYSIDILGWKDGKDIFMRTDLYIDIV